VIGPLHGGCQILLWASVLLKANKIVHYRYYVQGGPKTLGQFFDCSLRRQPDRNCKRPPDRPPKQVTGPDTI